MARDTQLLEQLQGLLLREAGVGAPPPALQEALSALATAPDVVVAGRHYREVLAATVATAGAQLDDVLTHVAAAPVAFLGSSIVGALIEHARGVGTDLEGGVDLGPAGVTVTAPSVGVRPAPDAAGEIARYTLGHLPVTGLDARVRLGPVDATGDGYIDTAGARAGALLRADLGPARVDLSLLIDSRDGLAVLALLRGDFRPAGIQLGLGFSLDAVGGIVGVNRGVDGAALRDRIADATALDALFGGGATPDRVRGAFDALRTSFPPAPGSHVAGPVLRLGWLSMMGRSLASLDIGVITVVPSGRVLLPGRIVVEVPGAGVPLVHLRLDVLGEIDVPGGRLALDAALVDSKVMGCLTVSGTAAVRMAWRSPAVVLATAGGFYPGFHHEPVVIPPQRRIGVTIGNPLPLGLRLSLEGYVATAAGTLQAGASLSAAFEVAETGVSGTATFDAIAQLSPLWFEARVHGQAALRAFGQKLLGVDLHGTLTGPGPLVLTATATGEILLFDVGGTKSFVLSGSGGSDRRPFDGLPQEVRRQLDEPANVTGTGAGDPDVVLDPRPARDAPLLPPGAALQWAQEAFPLDGPFSKAAGRVLRNPSSVVVSPAGPAGRTAVRRRLTTAAYAQLSGADVLAVPPFEEREAGWQLQPTTTRADPTAPLPTDHRTVRLPVSEDGDMRDRRWPTTHGVALPFELHAALRALDHPAAPAAGVGPATDVQPEQWAALTRGGSTLHPSGAAAHAHASLAVDGRAIPVAAAGAVGLP